MHTTSATHFYLPDYLCPLQKGICFPGDYKAVGVKSIAWLNGFNALTDRQRTMLSKTNSELLSAKAYPYASEERFTLCCDGLNLLWAVDEISDDQDKLGARKTGELFINCLKYPEYKDDSPLARLTKDFRKRFFEMLPPYSAKRFMKNVEEWVNAFISEASHRDVGDIIDSGSYVTRRRNGSAINLVFDFVAFGLEVDLPDDVFDDPAFLKVYYAANDMIWWSNDLYSFKMEHNKGHGGSNIVTILMHEQGMDLQTAANYIGKECKKLMDTYFEERKNVRSWGKELDVDVERYISALGQWVIANMEWSLETKRYFGEAFEEVQKTRLVRL